MTILETTLIVQGPVFQGFLVIHLIPASHPLKFRRGLYTRPKTNMAMDTLFFG